MTWAVAAPRSQSLAQVASGAQPSALPTLSPFLRFAKIKGKPNVLAAAKHNLRELPHAANIDPERSHLNQVLIGPTTAQAVQSHFNTLLATAGIGKLRKDAVLLIEAIVSLPVGLHDQDLTYFHTALAWFRKQFGHDNLLSATLHNDESAQHLHVLIVPLVNGAMNGSDLLGGPQHIAALQRQFRQTMQPLLNALGFAAPATHYSLLKAEMAAATLAHLKRLEDPALHSALWQPLRDCVERDPRLFYESLNCPPLLSVQSPARPIRPRKRKPTMTQIFTRPVGKLRGFQVEKYRQSAEYKRAHAVYVRSDRKLTPAARVTQTHLKHAAPEFPSPCLPTCPQSLRTLCSVGFSLRLERAAPPPQHNVFQVFLPRTHQQDRTTTDKPWSADDGPPPPPHRQARHNCLENAVHAKWRWSPCWPRAPPAQRIHSASHNPSRELYPMNQEELRQLWRCYCRASTAHSAALRASGYANISPGPAFPEELRHLMCGAQTRAGTPCKITVIYSNGRCKLHGGLSTGPKSKKGKAQSRINGKQGGRPVNSKSQKT